MENQGRSPEKVKFHEDVVFFCVFAILSIIGGMILAELIF